MKSGWYVRVSDGRLVLRTYNNDGWAGYTLYRNNGWHMKIGGMDCEFRPATKQDIIDLLLPTIEEKKELGQVAYEARLLDVRVETSWEDLSSESKANWARVEQAVKESLKGQE